MFSSPSSSTVWNGKQITAMGNGGQISRDALTGVLGSQTTRRRRRWGDAMTIARHLRHTCASVCQPHADSTGDSKLVSFLYESKISRRISSGSTSIGTRAMWLSQRFCCGDTAKRETYVDVVLHEKRSSPPSSSPQKCHDRKLTTQRCRRLDTAL